ncbi:ribonuclease E inhibitor RraB [Arthrobacter russicus]|uniref:Regulator of RNase E activity RraB n=1 Tax=Arthrobacter russicus TaxID=172040 RepID=A0ABU1J8S6_9MICC|nr:ribonuclease E inhibitor RraB [Arthrobacter russicus]MDR6268276.1 regulator of RNase E activity RraB [Arthrobacter russicus]
MKPIDQLVRDEVRAAQPQLAHRRRLGDDLSKIRPVDHNLIFRDFDSAKAVQSELEARGFTTDLWMDRTFFLDAQKASALSDVALAAAFTEVISVAAHYDFEYDGWGASIET